MNDYARDPNKQYNLEQEVIHYLQSLVVGRARGGVELAPDHLRLYITPEFGEVAGFRPLKLDGAEGLPAGEKQYRVDQRNDRGAVEQVCMQRRDPRLALEDSRGTHRGIPRRGCHRYLLQYHSRSAERE